MAVTFAEKLARIPHYSAGMSKAEARERFQAGDVVKLASNESPFAPVPAVLEAIAGAGDELNRYPDAEARVLRQALAERFDFSPERVAVGNGSCEILLAAAEALLEPGTEIVYAWPAFSMYPHLAALVDVEAGVVPLAKGDVHDLDAMARAVTDRTRLLVACNPNNPTGTYLDMDHVEGLLKQVPSEVCVILDQAYIDFQTVEDPDVTLELLDRYQNLVLLRTFSKIYGLAGLRCGYALCSREFRLAVDSVRQPFSVNELAQVAAAEALNHQDDVLRRVERNATERLWVEEELAGLGLSYVESQANFSWVRIDDPSEREVLEGLAGMGVIVRGGEGLGAAGHLRVTYGTRDENKRFIEALQEVLQG